MNTKSTLLQDTWEIVQHNWHETSINAKENQQRICKLDTEDWDVNEDNQDELENIQLQVAHLIIAAPNMLNFLNQLQKEVNAGQASLNTETQEKLQKIINQATKSN